MSRSTLQKSIETIDFLLDVLKEADKQVKSESTTTGGSAVTTGNDDIKEDYFVGAEDNRISEGMTVKVTLDPKKLKDCWESAELGPNDALHKYCGCIGKVIEVEEDDDTFKLRWENLDTCWMPIKACIDANGAKPTMPAIANAWLK
mmetsp:Transcript_104147/g.127233  ORF Transcript_104147/g.127233 Transcript_104147/m.127233 type:complete len:146 (-) Transcript_104147:47-484(-)